MENYSHLLLLCSFSYTSYYLFRFSFLFVIRFVVKTWKYMGFFFVSVFDFIFQFYKGNPIFKLKASHPHQLPSVKYKSTQRLTLTIILLLYVNQNIKYHILFIHFHHICRWIINELDSIKRGKKIKVFFFVLIILKFKWFLLALELADPLFWSLQELQCGIQWA